MGRSVGIAALLLATGAAPATADQEASNVAHVAAGPYGRCYAKSVPRHRYDPEGTPRQAGRTEVYRVEPRDDVLLDGYDWFSQSLFVLCRGGLAGEVLVVRFGPWQRGHDPRPDHLAIAFYRGGQLLKSYSTLDIAGDEKAAGLSSYKNVSASVSHYSVFETWPTLVKLVSHEGAVYSETWIVTARTVDGRELTFDPVTGALLAD